MVSTNIRFFSEKIPFVVRQKKLLRDWIVSTIISEEKDLANLNVIFCDDKYLHEINFKYLTHDTFTDIVTFDFSENDLLSGDLYISIDRVRENASIYNKKVV
nr:rRNA maturation RNase YbeY [Bacteroidota bacterium]